MQQEIIKYYIDLASSCEIIIDTRLSLNPFRWFINPLRFSPEKWALEIKLFMITMEISFIQYEIPTAEEKENITKGVTEINEAFAPGGSIEIHGIEYPLPRPVFDFILEINKENLFYESHFPRN